MTDLLSPPLAAPPAPADAALAATVAERLVLAVAPSTGRFQPCVASGDEVAPGVLLGVVGGGRGRADAVAIPVGGAIRGLLVRAGQLVRRGEPLVWVERDTAGERTLSA